MSIEVAYQLFCDGCEAVFDGAAGLRTSGTVQRKAARLAGWLTGQAGQDFCAACRTDRRKA